MARKQRKVEPKMDPAFVKAAIDMFTELNDLQAGSDVLFEPYGNPDMVEVIGTLWDGRPFSETYKREGGEYFIVKAIGCRYRVQAGEFYHGRTRRYAAFLVR